MRTDLSPPGAGSAAELAALAQTGRQREDWPSPETWEAALERRFLAEPAQAAVVAWISARGAQGLDPRAVSAMHRAEERLGATDPQVAERWRYLDAQTGGQDRLASLTYAGWSVAADRLAAAPVADALRAWEAAEPWVRRGDEDAGLVASLAEERVAELRAELLDELARRMAAGDDALAVLGELRAGAERVALVWRPVVGVEKTLRAHVGPYEATVTQWRAVGDEKFDWHICPSAASVPRSKPGFTAADLAPVAEGRAATMADGVAAVEVAVARLSQVRVMTAEEMAAYFDARPALAAQVAAHAHELAVERGLVPPAPPAGSALGGPSPASAGPLARAFPDAGSFAPGARLPAGSGGDATPAAARASRGR